MPLCDLEISLDKSVSIDGANRKRSSHIESIYFGKEFVWKHFFFFRFVLFFAPIFYFLFFKSTVDLFNRNATRMRKKTAFTRRNQRSLSDVSI